MSSGYWDNERKRWLIVGIQILGAAIAALCLWSLASYEQKYSDRLDYEAEHRQSVPVNSCWSLPFGVSVCQGSDDEAKAETERSKEDLHAQQEMAKWSIVVGICAIIGLLATLATTVMLFFTLRYAKESADAGQLAAKAATEATTAAVRSADAAEKTLLAERRPWVSIKMTRILNVSVAPGRVDVIARFRVKTLNNNPANDVWVSLKAFRIRGNAISREDVEREAEKLKKNADANAIVSSVVLPGQKATFDRSDVALWFIPPAPEYRGEFRIGLIAIVTYRAFGSDVSYHTGEVYVVGRRREKGSEDGSGFFPLAVEMVYGRDDLEVGHPRIQSHAS